MTKQDTELQLCQVDEWGAGEYPTNNCLVFKSRSEEDGKGKSSKISKQRGLKLKGLPDLLEALTTLKRTIWILENCVVIPTRFLWVWLSWKGGGISIEISLHLFTHFDLMHAKHSIRLQIRITNGCTGNATFREKKTPKVVTQYSEIFLHSPVIRVQKPFAIRAPSPYYNYNTVRVQGGARCTPCWHLKGKNEEK